MTWAATVDRLYGLGATEQSFTKTTIEKLLTMPQSVRLSDNRETLVRMHAGMAHIAQEWLVNTRPFSVSAINRLLELSLTNSEQAQLAPIFPKEKELKQLLEYIQTPNDHPVTQAATGFGSIMAAYPDNKILRKVAYLISYALLYRQGWNIRGLLVLEDAWNLQREAISLSLQSIHTTSTLTQWLEYASQAVVSHLTNIKDHLSSPIRSELPNHFFELSDRQKAILTVLESPEITITNRSVQKRFKVSQITASRDLSKLATLQLVVARGKGRSVYYSKI